MNEQLRTIAPEAEKIPRLVRAWLNGYEGKPAEMVDVEFLGEEERLAIITVQAAYKTKEYILGGYEAQYQFGIVYRSIPVTANDRLAMDEVLNEFGAWAESNPIVLDDPCATIKVSRNTNAALLYAYDNNTEDHQILMTLIYEVNV